MPSGNIEIFQVAQRSAEWFELRRGVPTASMFGTILAEGKERGSDSKGRASYMRKLAAEIITGEAIESYTNDDMTRGIQQEPEILARYAFEADAHVTPVGFIKNRGVGCSPDGLIGDRGMVQIKSAAPHVMIEILEAGVVPKKHLPQCLGELWVAEREWTDLVIGSSPLLPLFVHRIERDEREILNIGGAVHKFTVELKQLVQRIEALS